MRDDNTTSIRASQISSTRLPNRFSRQNMEKHILAKYRSITLTRKTMTKTRPKTTRRINKTSGNITSTQNTQKPTTEATHRLTIPTPRKRPKHPRKAIQRDTIIYKTHYHCARTRTLPARRITPGPCRLGKNHQNEPASNHHRYQPT